MFKKIINIFNKLRAKVSTLRLMATDDNPLVQAGKEATTKESSVQSCTRDAATRARVGKAFSEQEQQMQARALKAHESTCDPLTCDKNICFKREPDQIKEKSIVKRRMTIAKAKLACRKKTS